MHVEILWQSQQLRCGVTGVLINITVFVKNTCLDFEMQWVHSLHWPAPTQGWFIHKFEYNKLAIAGDSVLGWHRGKVAASAELPRVSLHHLLCGSPPAVGYSSALLSLVLLCTDRGKSPSWIFKLLIVPCLSGGLWQLGNIISPGMKIFSRSAPVSLNLSGGNRWTLIPPVSRDSGAVARQEVVPLGPDIDSLTLTGLLFLVFIF